MANIKKVLCENCAHGSVCQYKDDYIKILEAIKNATVNERCSDDGKISLKSISSYDFISNISVICKHYINVGTTTVIKNL